MKFFAALFMTAALLAPTAAAAQVVAPLPSKQSALSTTVKSVRSSSNAVLQWGQCYNSNATIEYVQVFDVATAGAVTLGTTVPTLALPMAPTSVTNLFGSSYMQNGIQVAATTTAGGLTAPAAALDCNFGYN